MEVLDLGCGFSPQSDSTILIDTNEAIIKEFPDKKVIIHNLNKPLPLPDSTIDKIYAFEILEHLNISVHDFLKECYRVLKPDGIIILSMPNSFYITTRLKIFIGEYITDASYHPFHYKFLKPSYVITIMRYMGFSSKFLRTTRWFGLEQLFPDLFARGIRIKARKKR